MDEEFPIDYGGEMVELDLHPCDICGRKFVPETLVKHAKICEKSASKKRKVFDSSKMRKRGTGMDTTPVRQVKELPPSKKKNNWREKHEQFIESMQSARQVTHAIKTGAPLPPPPSQKSRVNPDYVECPSCNRNFSQGAAERHISWCKEKSKRIHDKPNVKAKKDTLNIRTQYKPPLPGSGGKKKPSPVTSRTNSFRQRQEVNSSPSLEDQFNGSMSLGKKTRGRAPAPLNGLKARSASLERSALKKISSSRNSSGDIYKGRIMSEDEYDATDSDDYHNGYSYDSPPRSTRNSHILPHQKLKYQNERSSPLTSRAPTPPSSRRYSSDSMLSNDTGRRSSKFCYECGTKYPVPHAKYCCECGTKRPYMD